MSLPLGALAALLTTSAPAARVPVIVELFSSEGCSSCPDADAVLAELDAQQPVAGAQVIALELHVDYWNSLGWRDPFSSADFSQRQARYEPHLDRAGVYTPQMVVDGAAELVGSDRRAALDAIAAAGARPHPAQVALRREGAQLRVQVEGAAAEAEVLMAITEAGLSTHVERGENAGRTLRHGPIVRVLHELGRVGADGRFAGSVPVSELGAHQRAVVFVQAPASGPIGGAAAIEG